MRQVPWDPTAAPTFWINHASRLLMRRFDERLRPLGFSMAYLQVGQTLREHGPLQQTELLRFIHVEQPTLAALLKRMERDGIIARKPDPKDSRARLVTLTSRANKALDQAKDATAEVADRALADIAGSDRERLIGTLRQVVRNLSDEDSERVDLGLTD